MNFIRSTVSFALVFGMLQIGMPLPASASTSNPGYSVKNSGGSIDGKTGDNITLSVTSELISISNKKGIKLLEIKPSQVTELTYGQEVHRRIGTAAALAVVSLGVGAIVAFSKSKQHFVGITWDCDGKKGGLTMQLDKGDYRGILSALEGVTGQKAINTDDATNKK